jgi:hypothetical protein
MKTVTITEYELSQKGEFAVRNYICGNMTNISELAKILTETEGRKFHRQSVVNLIATILPYWYRIGKINLGHDKNTIEELT